MTLLHLTECDVFVTDRDIPFLDGEAAEQSGSESGPGRHVTPGRRNYTTDQNFPPWHLSDTSLARQWHLSDTSLTAPWHLTNTSLAPH